LCSINPLLCGFSERGDVTIASIGAALQSAAERMDRESDILFLILTSHGSQAGVAVQAGRREEILSPVDLEGMLNRAGVRHRIVVISACYSGVFLRPLANDDTLVITAADANHSSFGCQDKVKWIYFGDAFFNTALRDAADLRTRGKITESVLAHPLHIRDAIAAKFVAVISPGVLRSAFASARTLIGLREMRYGLVSSNPQIAGGTALHRHAAPSEEITSLATQHPEAEEMLCCGQ
jgi:hypothetical protein